MLAHIHVRFAHTHTANNAGRWPISHTSPSLPAGDPQPPPQSTRTDQKKNISSWSVITDLRVNPIIIIIINLIEWRHSQFNNREKSTREKKRSQINYLKKYKNIIRTLFSLSRSEFSRGKKGWLTDGLN